MFQFFKREKIKSLRNTYSEYNYLNNDDFVKQIMLDGKLVDRMKKKQKEKIIIFIFGNETRGVSEYARSISHHKLVIPQYGYPDMSYNISVSNAIVLYHLMNLKILPGTFDFSDERGLELVARKLLDMNRNMSRGELKKLGLDTIIDF